MVLTLGGMREAGGGCSQFSPPVTSTFLGEWGSLAVPGNCGGEAAPEALRVAHGSRTQGAVGEKAQEMSGWEHMVSSAHRATQPLSKCDFEVRKMKNFQY